MAVTTPVSRVAEALEALHASAPERQVERDLRVARQVKITLAKDAKRPITLSWNTGKKTNFDIPQVTRKQLGPGDSYVTDIGRAEAWFGPFTIPFDLRGERDERVRREMARRFEDGKRYALNAWGDYPRSKTFEPVGPHRFPHVTLEVMEADGEPWAYGTIDLHELYGIGAFDTIKFVDEEEVALQADAEKEDLYRQLAELRGQVSVLLSNNTKAKA